MSTHSDVFSDALNGTAVALLEDTESLLGIVDRLHGLPGTAALADAGARPDFRAELRTRLLDEAGKDRDDADSHNVVSITSRWNQSWGRRNRVRIVSGIAAGVVGLTAVSIAASNSLPGSPFYQLKRGSESVQYALAGSDEARGKLELGFARTRLHEIDRLTQHDAAFGIAPTLQPQAAGGTTILATSVGTKVVRLFADMDDEAAKGSVLLTRSFANDPRPGPLLAVQAFARDQEASLTTLRARLSGPALTKATHSLAWATSVAKTTTAVLATCSPTTCPQTSVTQLGGSLNPSLAPSSAPSGSPSQPPASRAPGAVIPSGQPAPTPPQSTVTAPSSASPTGLLSPQPTLSQSTLPPAPTSAQPTQTQTGAPTTTGTPVQTPTTDAPTVPPTSPVDTPSQPVGTTTAPPPPPSLAPPSTVPPSSAEPSIPPTTPVPTTAAPPPSSTAPTVAPTIVATTTDPVMTDPATTVPASTSPASHTGRPTKICLPPSRLIKGVCIRLPLPPGVGGHSYLSFN